MCSENELDDVWFFTPSWILTNWVLCPPGSWMRCTAVKKKKSPHPSRCLLHLFTWIAHCKIFKQQKYTLHYNVLYIERVQSWLFFPWARTFSMMLLYVYSLSSHSRTLGKNILRPIFTMTCHSHKTPAVISHMFCKPVRS